MNIKDLKKIPIHRTVSLADATDLEFKDWLADKLIGAGYTPNEIELSYSPTLQERAKAIARLQQLLNLSDYNNEKKKS
jgi:hypothetical protein